jgi:hypothetical protein
LTQATNKLLLPPAALVQVPQLLNYQGRIAVNGTNFTGTGQFKFALVDGGINAARASNGNLKEWLENPIWKR